MSLQIHYEQGTLVVPALPAEAEAVAERYLKRDPRGGVYRAPGRNYRDLVLSLRAAKIPYEDHARAFSPLPLPQQERFIPYPHQAAALDAWWKAGRRGVVELPTGAGKTALAVLAMEKIARPTLVLVPTIDLMLQWQAVLQERFGVEVGMIGGGSQDKRPITVTTYQSASMQVEFFGHEFGFLIADECHHLPAPAYRFIAEAMIAPFRLGLSATVARADGMEEVGYTLLGPLVYQQSIEGLEGQYLSPYEVVSVSVELSEAEAEAYEAARGEYLDFLRGSGVRLDQGGWQRFVAVAHQSEEGRSAYRAFRLQKRIALFAEAKIEALWQLLVRHKADRVIVFSEDNESVYAMSERFLAPAITHQTKPKERKRILSAFAAGEIKLVFTAKVLNEGVDVPEANVGVVLAGSGSVREHVQRLGRILRRREGKRATLYEITTEVAAEQGISERRRQHEAYQRGGG